MIWREFTGKDIGLDGAIECSKNEDGVAQEGWVFVQLKTQDSPFTRKRSPTVVFRADQKHHAYWLAQDIPVLIVLVERPKGRYVPVRAHLLNYHGVPRQAQHIKASTIAIDPRGLQNWDEVYSCVECSDLEAKASDVSRWIEKIVRSKRELMLLSALRKAEERVESGQPSRALQIFKRDTKTNLEDISLSADHNSVSLVAKCLRRAGKVRELEAFINRVGPHTHSNRQLTEVLAYERGFALMIAALQDASNSSLWKRSLQWFRRSKPLANNGNALSARAGLIAQTGITHTLAMRAELTGTKRHLRVATNHLGQLLSNWRRRTSFEREELRRREINAGLVLVRSFLALGETKRAAIQFEKVKQAYKDPSCFHSTVWLAHLLTVQAWLSIENGEHTKAELLLKAVGDTAAGFEEDPELHGYFKCLVKKLNMASSPNNGGTPKR